MVDGRPDLGVLASGQVVALIDDLPSCEELIDRIITQAAETLRSLRALPLPSPTALLRQRAGSGVLVSYFVLQRLGAGTYTRTKSEAGVTIQSPKVGAGPIPG
jgi:hypothetical protein